MSKVLQTPSLEPLPAFDSKYEHKIPFVYYDDQIIQNRVVITNSTGIIVYDKTEDTMKLMHTLPPNSISPGQYLAQIQVFDSLGNASNLSEPILFYCYSTPIFILENITDGMVYRNASLNLILRYEQAEGESLKSYIFQLYDYQKTLIKQSNDFYSSEIKNYVFYGLENHQTYYFRCLGETEHGFKLDTGLINIFVEYNVVPANVIFQVTNNDNGYISLQSNIVDIGYELENPNYILKNGALTLKDNSLKYNNGFTIDGDFALFIEAKLLPYGTFLKTESGIFSLSIKKICRKYYCEFCTSNYHIYSELPKAQLSNENNIVICDDQGRRIEIINLEYDDKAFVVFELKRKNNIYNLKTYFKENYLE